jgi:hypothetical protein
LVVRVKILVEAKGGRSIESSAILNSSYEADVLEIALPVKAAQKLKLPLKKGRVERYGTAGSPIRVKRIPDAVKIYLKVEDREVGPIPADAVILRSEEILLSDKLIDELGIILDKVGEGLWRFRDDPPSKIRRSTALQRW